MKRDDALDKRTFSASERRSDARSGAAESDGSFPIKNKQDLHNAMRAVGRSKNPAKTKAHIRARAKALGLTSELSAAFKSKDNSLLKTLGFLKGFGVNKDALAESIKSIVEDDEVDAVAKGAMIDETFKQFSETVESDLEKAVTEADSVVPSDEDKMSAALAKALGLADTASTDEIIAAVAAKDAALAKAAADAEAVAKAAHDAELAKAAAANAEMAKRIEALETEREVAKFVKIATDAGLPASKGEVIMKARKGDVESFDEVLGMLKAAVVAVDNSQLFVEKGASGPGVSDDAVENLKTKAAELRKAKPELTEEQAFAKVYADPANRKLAAAERRQNRPLA